MFRKIEVYSYAGKVYNTKESAAEAALRDALPDDHAVIALAHDPAKRLRVMAILQELS